MFWFINKTTVLDICIVNCGTFVRKMWQTSTIASAKDTILLRESVIPFIGAAAHNMAACTYLWKDYGTHPLFSKPTGAS